jgi:SAM-dependent methyltransferase
MTSDQDFPLATWAASYRNAGTQRLWPQEPTVALDLDGWRAQQVRTVLDAGCGDGKNLAYLIRHGFFAIGIDASLSALIKCRQYLQEQAFTRDYLLITPTLLDKVPLLDDSVDAAICVDVLGHVQEPLPILRELARVVRPGGYVYASLFHVEDGCRLGPRMKPVEPSSGLNEFWYRTSGADVTHYFRFYDEAEALALLESSPMRLIWIEPRRWREPPHPGYRDEPHEHESWFALLQKGS